MGKLQNWSAELDRWYRRRYQFPVNEIIDKLVGDLKMEGKSEDKKVGGIVFRKPNLKVGGGELNDTSIRGQVSFEAIRKSWLFGGLTEHLKI